MKRCPFCAEEIQDDAIRCRWCGEMHPGSLVSDGDAPRGRTLSRSLVFIATGLAVVTIAVSSVQLLKETDPPSGLSPQQDGPQTSTAASPTVPFQESTAPDLIPFEGVPTVWSLSRDETYDLFGDLVYGSGPSAVSACRSYAGRSGDLISGNTALQSCLRPHLSELGIQQGAIDLLFSLGLIVWRAEQVGPFWLADVDDIDLFGANYGVPPYAFTPRGIVNVVKLMETWEPLAASVEAAYASELVAEVRDAYGQHFGSPSSDIRFSLDGWDFRFNEPYEADGWILPFDVRLAGCHACKTPLLGRFLLRATPDGMLTGASFAGLCYERDYLPDDDGDIPSGNVYDLPECAGDLLRQ